MLGVVIETFASIEASDACCGKKNILKYDYMNKSSKSVNLIFIIGSFVNDFQHAKY